MRPRVAVAFESLVLDRRYCPSHESFLSHLRSCLYELLVEDMEFIQIFFQSGDVAKHHAVEPILQEVDLLSVFQISRGVSQPATLGKTSSEMVCRRSDLALALGCGDGTGLGSTGSAASVT